MKANHADCRVWNQLFPNGTLCEVLLTKFGHLAVAVKGPSFIDSHNNMMVRVTDIKAPVPVRIVRPFMGDC